MALYEKLQTVGVAVVVFDRAIVGVAIAVHVGWPENVFPAPCLSLKSLSTGTKAISSFIASQRTFLPSLALPPKSEHNSLAKPRDLESGHIFAWAHLY